MNTHRKNCILGLACILFFTMSILFGYMQLLLGISLNKPIGLYLAIFVVFMFLYIEKQSGRMYGIFLCLVVMVFALATYMHDFSYDGQWYHMQAIKALAEGWNFYYEPNFDKSIWIMCYAKATWVFGALLYAVTGSLLTAKGYHFLMLISNSALAYSILSSLNIKYKKIFTFLIVANPVTLSMMFSTYLDDLVYELGISLFFVYYIYRHQNKFKINKTFLWICMLAITCTLVNIKFTAVAYAATIWFCIVCDYGYNKRLLNFVKKVFAIAVISVLLIGFNPYVTNYIAHGHPFYPLQGEGNLYSVVMNGTGGSGTFAEQNRFLKLGEVTFSKCADLVINDVTDIEYKIPGMIYKSELVGLTSVSARRGGFGVWFSLALIMSLIVLMALLYKNEVKGKWMWIFIGILFSIAINPECWVARYVPQLALLPVIVAMLSVNSSSYNVQKAGKILVFILLINCSVSALVSSAGYVRMEFMNYTEIQKYKNTTIEVYSDGTFDSAFETRLDYSNIKYTRVNRLDESFDLTLPVFSNEKFAIKIIND